jgi:hypothetical protein
MTTPSKASQRMVPADQPEAWPFAPGDVVRDSGEDGDDAAWLEAAPEWTVVREGDGDTWERRDGAWWYGGGNLQPWASANLSQTYGPLTVVSVPATHAARPAAPTAPATPRVGAGTSEGAPCPQIGAGELGLGDALRLHATMAPTRLQADDLRALADRADALEQERDQWRDSAKYAVRQVERVRALADGTGSGFPYVQVADLRAIVGGTQ